MESICVPEEHCKKKKKKHYEVGKRAEMGVGEGEGESRE